MFNTWHPVLLFMLCAPLATIMFVSSTDVVNFLLAAKAAEGSAQGGGVP
jgi:hypothetical protein